LKSYHHHTPTHTNTHHTHHHRSQNLTQKAQEAGVFTAEIAPVEVKGRKGVEVVSDDEHPRKNAVMADMAKLKAVFKDGGVVTAGSASGICDGAASLVLADEDAVKANGLTPLVRVVAWNRVGCDPTYVVL
jgi:acetyl-CoA acyltransferase 2